MPCTTPPRHMFSCSEKHCTRNSSLTASPSRRCAQDHPRHRLGRWQAPKRLPLLNMMTMDPQTVAEAGIRAMLARDATMVLGFWNKTIVFLDRLMPRPMQRAVFGKVTAG